MVYATHLTIAKSARLLGLSPSAAWRRAMKGKLGPLVSALGCKKLKLVSIAELERRTGQVFTPQQIAEAAATPAQTPSPYVPRRPAYAPNPGDAVEYAIAKRDAEWRQWLNSPKEQVKWPLGPPRAFRAFEGRNP